MFWSEGGGGGAITSDADGGLTAAPAPAAAAALPDGDDAMLRRGMGSETRATLKSRPLVILFSGGRAKLHTLERVIMVVIRRESSGQPGRLM